MATQEAIRIISLVAAPGTSTLKFTVAPDKSAFRPGGLIVIDPHTVEAEIRRILSVSGATVTLEKPLTYGHANPDHVFSVLGGSFPWEWWGGRPGAIAYASDNVLGFNRLAQEMYKSAPGSRIEVGVGSWFVNDQLRPERDQGIKGSGPTSSLITATSDFPFDSTGEVAIIHPQRDGNPVGYAADTNTTRCFIEDILVNGNHVPNSNGLLLKVQQPNVVRNLRVDYCMGLYGLSVQGQDGEFDNIEIIGCQVPLRVRAHLMRFKSLNVEKTQGDASVIVGEVGGVWNSFSGVHFECDRETVGFAVRGGASAFSCRDFYYANPVTGTGFHFDTPGANPGSACRYVLENIWCNQNSQTFKMVDDIQRGKSLTSWNTSTDRWIDYLTPRVLMAGYVKTP